MVLDIKCNSMVWWFFRYEMYVMYVCIKVWYDYGM